MHEQFNMQQVYYVYKIGFGKRAHIGGLDDLGPGVQGSTEAQGPGFDGSARFGSGVRRDRSRTPEGTWFGVIIVESKILAPPRHRGRQHSGRLRAADAPEDKEWATGGDAGELLQAAPVDR